MIEFLWNAVGKPAATIKSVPFTDVPESGSDDYWYEDALLWAYEAGIVAGTNDGTTFSPDQGLHPCRDDQLHRPSAVGRCNR
ncbi:MAG: S-layer homology domain-containing protein [Oscillospiraceae bacterium]